MATEGAGGRSSAATKKRKVDVPLTVNVYLDGIGPVAAPAQLKDFKAEHHRTQ
jgi:hypothetical protein